MDGAGSDAAVADDARGAGERQSMRWSFVKRRLVVWLSAGQVRYCRRCGRWRPIAKFYHVDESGNRTLYRQCRRCQVHPRYLDDLGES
jgi:hypothetical protein